MVSLRDFRPQDFDTLCEIDRLCFPPGIAYSADDIAMMLLERGSIVIVAEDSDRIAGFLLARAAKQGHIVTIDVLQEFRKSGVGTALMEEAHRRLSQAGTRRVQLETSVENDAAIAFYKKLGYSTARRIKGYYLGKIDAYRMYKDL